MGYNLLQLRGLLGPGIQSGNKFKLRTSMYNSKEIKKLDERARQRGRVLKTWDTGDD